MTTADAPDTARTADLTGIALAHRLMRTDLHRLTATARSIAGGEDCPARRAGALARWVELLCDEIHGHHTAEDDIAWPVIVRYAGHAIDLTDLSDDHAALAPLLATVRSAAGAVRSAPDGTRAAAAAELATGLATLRDEIDEHLDAEESELFPIIERYVPAAAWDEVVAGVRKSGPGLRFVLPRIIGVLDADEWAGLKREAGFVLVAFAAVLRPGHRRRERLVFG